MKRPSERRRLKLFAPPAAVRGLRKSNSQRNWVAEYIPQNARSVSAKAEKKASGNLITWSGWQAREVARTPPPVFRSGCTAVTRGIRAPIGGRSERL
jgi:hypothetical protein